MKKIYQYILMAVALMATASCSNELDETLQPVGNGNLQFVVSDFPAFDEGTATRAIGISDAGKTAWADGDEILVHLHSPKYGDQAATLQFKDGVWGFAEEGTLTYLDKEEPTITAVYAPDCEIKSNNTIGLKEGKQYGMAEYILANASIKYNTLNISFTGVSRTYSRLRIVAEPNEQLTVTTTGFTPAGASEATTTISYSLKADDKGNAYLYGTFMYGTQVKVVGLKEFYFQKDSEAGKSYVYDVRPLDVDLGLPSRTLWATRNVGADNPWDYGDYFAWGEISPKASYTWGNYFWGTQDNLTKYNSTDGITTLEAVDDAATENMGADWRMPTADDWTELINNCTWTWTTLNGANGYTIVGSNGNSIFLPAAGVMSNSSKSYANSQGLYWCNNLTNSYAYFLNFTSNKKSVSDQENQRFCGLSVRAVKKQ